MSTKTFAISFSKKGMNAFSCWPHTQGPHISAIKETRLFHKEIDLWIWTGVTQWKDASSNCCLKRLMMAAYFTRVKRAGASLGWLEALIWVIMVICARQTFRLFLGQACGNERNSVDSQITHQRKGTRFPIQLFGNNDTVSFCQKICFPCPSQELSMRMWVRFCCTLRSCHKSWWGWSKLQNELPLESWNNPFLICLVEWNFHWISHVNTILCNAPGGWVSIPALTHQSGELSSTPPAQVQSFLSPGAGSSVPHLAQW